MKTDDNAKRLARGRTLPDQDLRELRHEVTCG